MLAALRRRGYRIMTFSATWQCGAEPGDNGLEAQMLGFLAPGPVATPHCADVGGTSFILDVTSPAARAWWRDQVAAFVQRYGIDGIKLDRGEEHIPSAATDVWADGRTGREVHNAYPDLQTQIHYDALAAAHPDGDFVLFSRAGYTGTPRLTVFWGGDIPGRARGGRERHADRPAARLPRPQGPEAPRPVGPVPLRPGPHGGAGVEGGRAAAARVLSAREVAQLLGPGAALAGTADGDGRRAAGCDPGVRPRGGAGAGAGQRAPVPGGLAAPAASV